MLFIGKPGRQRVFFEMMQQFSPETPLNFDGADAEWIKLTETPLSWRLTASNGLERTYPLCKTRTYLMDEAAKRIFYRFLAEYYGKSLPWGILTGVKPAKFYKKLADHTGQPEARLKQDYYVRADKIARLSAVHRRQAPVLKDAAGKYSLYVGVPICPQRCTYCSFVSTVLDKNRALLTDYLKGLEEEIVRTAPLFKDRTLDTVYIGGGTPSVLTAEEAAALIALLRRQFDFSAVREFTFEAGRPETTTGALLDALREGGVTRVCLNPQSMNQATLEAVNRSHTPQDIRRVYREIRARGFESVNMDLICGLADEREADFLYSLGEVLSLRPENITVHNLSIKKGTAVKQVQGHSVRSAYSPAFYAQAEQLLKSGGYGPYYLYRQKYTVGNGENTGYALAGKESAYNILMMAEAQTIVGLGAGSSGKLYEPETDRFSHVFTVKDIRTYNRRTEEIIAKKLKAYRDYMARDSKIW